MRIFFKTKITVERLTEDVGDADKEGYASNGTIYGLIIPAGNDDIMITEGVPASSYMLYTYRESDIRETDRITDDGLKYIIKSMRPFKFQSIRLKQCVLSKMDS